MNEPAIGELRWRVDLVRQQQAPAWDGPGVTETPAIIATAWAKIEPVGEQIRIGSAQIEAPVTHRMWIRWRAGLDYLSGVRRTTRGPDGVERTETFRVRGAQDLAGRKRWLVVTLEEERRS